MLKNFQSGDEVTFHTVRETVGEGFILKPSTVPGHYLVYSLTNFGQIFNTFIVKEARLDLVRHPKGNKNIPLKDFFCQLKHDSLLQKYLDELSLEELLTHDEKAIRKYGQKKLAKVK